MRLIDADALMKELQEQMKTATNPLFAMVCDKCIDCLEKQPTAYDVEKVVEKITEKAERYCNSVSCEDNPRGLTYLCTDCNHYCLTKGVIDIVRKGGGNSED